MAIDIRNATDLESAIKLLDEKIEAAKRATSGAGGYIGGSQTTTQVTFSGETVVSYVVASLKEGRRYKVSWLGDPASQTSMTFVIHRFRFIPGSLPTSVAGTTAMVREFGSFTPGGAALPVESFAQFVAPSSGVFTVSATMQANAGSGYIPSGANHTQTLLLEDIGV